MGDTMGDITSCVPGDFSPQSLFPRAAEQPHVSMQASCSPRHCPDLLSHVMTLYKDLMCPVQARRRLHTTV